MERIIAGRLLEIGAKGAKAKVQRKRSRAELQSLIEKKKDEAALKNDREGNKPFDGAVIWM